MSHKINVNQLANALVLEMRKQLEMPEAFRALLVDQKRRDKEHWMMVYAHQEKTVGKVIQTPTT